MTTSPYMSFCLYDNSARLLNCVGAHGAGTQERVVPIKASPQVGAHALARRFSIAFDDCLNDLAMLFLKMEVVVLRARPRRRSLQLAARNDASTDQLEKLRKTPVLRGFRNRQVKLEIRI